MKQLVNVNDWIGGDVMKCAEEALEIYAKQHCLSGKYNNPEMPSSCNNKPSVRGEDGCFGVHACQALNTIREMQETHILVDKKRLKGVVCLAMLYEGDHGGSHDISVSEYISSRLLANFTGDK